MDKDVWTSSLVRMKNPMLRYSPGQVRDAILNALAQSKQAMSVKEIEAKVSQAIGPTPTSSVRSYLRLNTPASSRRPMAFKEVYLGEVLLEDFRKNARGELGTRTATLHAAGIKKLRTNWIYKLPQNPSAGSATVSK